MKNLTLLFLIAPLSFLLSCGTKENTKAQQPNILFIMSDDHAYQAISAYSDKLTQTPNIDRIAHNGMLFTNACVTNSICAPSRAVILTGKHSHINGKIDNNFPFDTSNVTFPQIMHDNGYQTAMFGKLHFGNSPKGFDEFKILPGQGHYYNPNFITKNEGLKKYFGYVTDIITDMTLNWLRNERETDKPFMLMYLHKAPHREWLPAPRHHKIFTKKKFSEPETLYDNYDGRGEAAHTQEMTLAHHRNWAGDDKLYPETMDTLGLEPWMSWDKIALVGALDSMDDEQRKAWNETYGPINEEFIKNYPNMTEKEILQWRYQRYMQDYCGSIAAVDEGVGKVLDYLEESGLAENTIVVYTSDQGFYLGEHGWFDKRFAYNESFKTPLLISWPGIIKPNSVNSNMVQNLDFAETFLDAAGVDIPKDMQGESLIPIFRDETQNFRDAVYYHYYEYPGIHEVKRHYAIVSKEYKLIHFYYDVDEWELYDRKKDPNEMQNEIDNPEYAEIKRKLKADLKELRIKYKDSDSLNQIHINKYKEIGLIE
ncbi:MAG: sulfatase [Bacteroidales bacterium]